MEVEDGCGLKDITGQKFKVKQECSKMKERRRVSQIKKKKVIKQCNNQDA